MPKSIYKSCKEIDRVFDAVRQDEGFDDCIPETVQDMFVRLSDRHFMFMMTHSYPSPWYKLADAICQILHIKKSFSHYDILKKAVSEIVAHPDYQIAIGYFLHEKTYYLEEFQSCDTSLIPL